MSLVSAIAYTKDMREKGKRSQEHFLNKLYRMKFNKKILILISIIVIVAMAIIAFSGYFSYQYFFSPRDKIREKDKIENKEMGFYVKFEYDENFSDTNPDKFIYEYISEILNTPINAPIFYDASTKEAGRFDRGYYIFLDSVANNISIDNIYKKGGLSIHVQKVNQEIVPFIKNSNYCENDNDCTIRFDNNCAYGSYNKFSEYLDIWGCEGILYPQEEQKQFSKICDLTKQHIEIKYQRSVCVNNKCSPVGKTISCEPGALF